MNLFIDGRKLVDTSKFDASVVMHSLTKDEILKADPAESNALRVIHERVNADQHDKNSPLIGNFDNLIKFAGDDVTSIINVGGFDNKAKILSQAGQSYWEEEIAWKSDIKRLEDRISTLENKIGGVFKTAYKQLISRMVVVA